MQLKDNERSEQQSSNTERANKADEGDLQLANGASLGWNSSQGRDGGGC